MKLPIYIQIVGIGLLALFTALMVNLTLPYLSFRTDVAFLRIKQWVFGSYSATTSSVWITAFYVHVLTSTFCLLAGFTQFFKKFLFQNLHRIMGRVYVIIVLVFAAPSGFIMSLLANGGALSITAFTTLSILWWVTTYLAYKYAVRGNLSRHSAFMFRSYALALSAITLRTWKFAFTNGLWEGNPMEIYMVVAWLGWVPNLLIAELLIWRKVHLKLLKSKRAA